VLQTVRGSRWWQAAVGNPQRIAIVLFAAIFTVLVINALIISDNDAIGSSPTARESDSVVARPSTEEGSSEALSLVAGLGLLGGWMVYGVFMFSKPTRERRARERSTEPSP
jgi:hypothetical protein